MFRFFEQLNDPYAEYRAEDRPPTRLWPFLWSYLSGFKRIFAASAVLAMVVASIELWLIYYMGRLIDDLVSAGAGSFWSLHGFELALVTAFVLVVRPLVQTLQVLVLNNAVMPNVGTTVRWRAHRHVLRQSVGWFEDDFAGRIANRIMQTPPAVGEATFQIFDAIAYSVAYFVGAIVLMSSTDPRLMLPLLAWLILYGWLVKWTVSRVGPASKAASDARSAVTGRVVDSYTNIHSVKLFAHHEKEELFAKDAIEEARRTFQVEMRIFTIMDGTLTFLNGLLIVSVVGWALYLWTGGSATVGVIAAASALVLRLNAMTGWIMWALTSFFQNLGVVQEGMETIAQPIRLLDAPDAKELALSEGKIELKGLTHHYGRGKGGLESIDLLVAPGQKVGVVGRSGAGKSTLVKLLLRFYDAESGSILIDGQDIRGVTQASLRRQIGMVQQDSSLLHRSVRDNILYGDPSASEKDMQRAASQAAADDFIDDLEDPNGRRGFDAHVGERGVKLSGGQRQRIALARVILKNAPILVLDEATSALDSEVEAAIQETLTGMMEGKTVIAIAHRLSTIAQMDRIIVLDDGRIVEDGTHGELLSQGGLYAGFWARQSGGFILTDDDAEVAAE
ncbi:MAG: ABC transporter ATP-binding protein [Pseudomonadota bacterium]